MTRLPLAACLVAIGLGPCLSAQTTLYWDPNGTGLGGSGTFTYGSSVTFNTASDGSGTQVDDASAANSLVFGGIGGTVTVTNNPVANSVTFNGASNYTVSGSSSFGAVNLRQTGTGTTTLAAGPKSDATGSTTVSAGTLIDGEVLIGNLLVDGGTYQANLSSIKASNTTLSSGALTLGSDTIAMGSGNYTFQMSGGTLNVTLGATSGTSAGAINANGATFSNLQITGGTLALTLGTDFSYSNTYTIFSGYDGTKSVSGLTITGYDISDYTAHLGASGALTFTPGGAVPEPSSYALIMGAAALAVAAWRRRSQSASAVA